MFTVENLFERVDDHGLLRVFSDEKFDQARKFKQAIQELIKVTVHNQCSLEDADAAL